MLWSQFKEKYNYDAGKCCHNCKYHFEESDKMFESSIRCKKIIELKIMNTSSVVAPTFICDLFQDERE